MSDLFDLDDDGVVSAEEEEDAALLVLDDDDEDEPRHATRSAGCFTVLMVIAILILFLIISL